MVRKLEATMVMAARPDHGSAQEVDNGNDKNRQAYRAGHVASAQVSVCDCIMNETFNALPY